MILVCLRSIVNENRDAYYDEVFWFVLMSTYSCFEKFNQNVTEAPVHCFRSKLIDAHIFRRYLYSSLISVCNIFVSFKVYIKHVIIATLYEMIADFIHLNWNLLHFSQLLVSLYFSNAVISCFNFALLRSSLCSFRFYP